LDTESCNSVSESVVPDGSMDIPLGLRLKLAGGKISEIETIAVRPGDYTVFGSPFASNTMAIAASRDRVKWEEVVPADQRNTYQEITGWLERYFKTFPRGGCHLADNCQRLENGGGSFECSAALSCDESAALTGSGALKPRLLIADTELGIGVGFTMFMGHTDFHMIKMHGGDIYAVHAILGAASNSGLQRRASAHGERQRDATGAQQVGLAHAGSPRAGFVANDAPSSRTLRGVVPGAAST
jgi:hypothetical protein